MNLNKYKNIYFIGAGGIGMSAIARYFNQTGKNVSGYDKTQTTLTSELIAEGISICFDDNIAEIPELYKNKENTLIIYTPAIPADSNELNYFKENNFDILKRSEVLGILTQNKKGIAIAGTHGKTTITTITAHLLKNSQVDCSAFLGGISKNYKSNLLVSNNSDYIVVEADEYDRSFLKLFPYAGVISAMDADHLDIYKDLSNLEQSFSEFANQFDEKGFLIIKKGLENKVNTKAKKFTYSLDDENSDFYAKNIRLENYAYIFDLITPENVYPNLKLNFPGLLNVENSIAALAIATKLGASYNDLKKSLENFTGIARRFDIQINTEKFIYIDDYAHHPQELSTVINSVKHLYKGKKITGVFQPHLYSRTQDFQIEFAESLDMLDDIILLDIYPARELPIEGVTSKIIFDKIKNKNKVICTKDELIEIIKSRNNLEVLLTLGAGDIDTLVEPIKEVTSRKFIK